MDVMFSYRDAAGTKQFRTMATAYYRAAKVL